MRLQTPEGCFEVQAQVGQRVEPVDGRVHLAGRIPPHPDLARLVRKGVNKAELDGVPIKMIEIDPWGGILIRDTDQ